MSTLVLDRAHLAVRDDGAALALYEGAERRGTVPIKLLERVIVQGHSLEIHSGALLKLAEHGVAVLFLSPRQSRRVALVLGPRHNDAAIRLAQARRVEDEAFRREWACGLVERKLARQRDLLGRLLKERPDCRKPLAGAQATLVRTHAQVARGGHPPETLRGLEGSAAAAYFRGLCSVFPESLGFTGRNRRPPRDPANACLSLGYTLLHFDAVRAAHAAGLDPLLGFYHRPAFGRESLACDLVEPLRPVVDAWVWRLFAERTLREEHFTRDKGACLLGKAGRGHFYAAWEASAKLPRRYLRKHCAVLAKQLREEGSAQIGDLFGDEDEEAF